MARFIPVKRPDGSEVASEQGVSNLGGGKSLADIVTSLGAKTLENIFDAVTDLQGPGSKTLTDVVTSLGSKTLGDIFDAVDSLKGAGSKTLTDVVSASGLTTDAVDSLKGAGSKTLTDVVSASGLTTDAVDSLKGIGSKTLTDVVSASGLTTDAVDSLKGIGSKTLTDVVSASGLTTDAVDSLKGTGSKTLTDVVSASGLTTDAVDSLKGTGSKTLTDIVTSLGAKTLENIFDAVTDLKGSGSKTLTDVVTSLGAKTLGDIFDAVTDLKGSGSKTLTDVVTALAGLPVSLGAKLSADSLSVTPATDAVVVVAGKSAVGEVPTVNPVGVSAIDPAGLKRALLADALGQLFTTEQDSAAIAATVTSATTLFTVDMTNWRSCMVQVTSAGSGCTVIYEGSNNNITWNTVVGLLANPNTATAASSNIAPTASIAALAYQFPKRYKYFRARVSIYGSGTVSISYCLSASEVNPVVAAGIWGQVPEGSAFSGNPVTIGLEARTSNKVNVGNGQIVRPIGTVDGKMIVRSHSIPENEWSYAAASGGILNGVTAVTIKAAAGAPYRNYLTSIQLEAEPVTNATEFVIRNGAGGAVLWRIKVPTTGLPLTNFKFENPLKSSSATLLEVVTLTASGTGAVYVNAQGYVAP